MLVIHLVRVPETSIQAGREHAGNALNFALNNFQMIAGLLF